VNGYSDLELLIFIIKLTLKISLNIEWSKCLYNINLLLLLQT